MRAVAVASAVGLAAAHTRSTFDAKEFVTQGPAARTAQMTFTVGLPSSNWERVQSMLAERSTPGNSLYTQWLSMPEVAAMTAPAPEVRAEVREWLRKHDATCVDWATSLRCTASAQSVETMFQTKVHSFTHVSQGGV